MSKHLKLLPPPSYCKKDKTKTITLQTIKIQLLYIIVYLTGILCRSCFNTSTKHLIISDNVLEEQKHEFIKKMERLSSQQPALNKDAMLAGVLVPFCTVNGKPSILFTKRSNKIVRNKSDVSFPGGKMDNKFDKNIIDTALRETMEEIGVPKSDIDVWIEMKPTIGTTVRSCMFFYDSCK